MLSKHLSWYWYFHKKLDCLFVVTRRGLAFQREVIDEQQKVSKILSINIFQNFCISLKTMDLSCLDFKKKLIR